MSALTAPVSRAVIKQFWRTFQPQHPEVKDVRSRAWWAAITIGLIVGIFGALMLIGGIVSAITEVNRDASGNDVGMAFVGGVMTVAGVALFWIGRRIGRQRTSPEMHYRLSQFAEDNNMYYQPGPWLGTYLTPWANRVGGVLVSRVLRTRTDPSIEYGNFDGQYAANDDSGAGFGGYVAIRLDTNLPNILLLSRRNASDRNLWRPIPPNTEKLSLEGNFDDYFTLYAPSGYEADALYLFTPDVMTNLMDEASAFDVEIIDDWVFLTTRRDAVTTDPARWAMLTGAASAITAKFAQWDRWRDDRIAEPTSAAPAAVATPDEPPEDSVAPQGQRLRFGLGTRGNTLVTVIAAAFLISVLFLHPGSTPSTGASGTSPSAVATASSATSTP